MDSCNIKVAIKVRPLNNKEQSEGRIYWNVESNSVIHIDPTTEKKNGEQFLFDKVFSGSSTNYDVFDEIVRPIIDRGVQGFNGTVFAYGQTASGKTYTMSGDQSCPGIIPLAINYMFNVMNSSTSREFLLRACYLEIYNEKLIDLLEINGNKNQRKKIEIQKDGLHITPLKAIVCQNAQMVIDLMKIGDKNRSIGETNMNERSSRSHTIFRIILESRNIDDDCNGAYQQSVINLVDLAGSERSSQTQSSLERFKEGCKINSSLTTLGLVIQQLSECPDSSQHINFRDSKLTRILQTSLGGNSLTAIICTISVAVDDQTNNTLSFASRAKKIKNIAKVNENISDETLLKRYRVQLSKLNKELEGIKQHMYETDEVNEIKYKYQEEKRTNEELKERIMRLQKNMITSSIGQKDQSLNKKGQNRRRTWGGKLENTFSSGNILATIEEDVNMPRPSVPSNFEFKTPLESFEWDLIREEDQKVDNESLNNENTSYDFSPPASIALSVCETPKKVLRERVNNYKNMFEMSMKENNELREFTTLEKQMFHDNNEQLKDLSNLRKKIDDLQNEKNESAKIIEKLKCSVQLVENEKRDVEITMEIQKQKFEKREVELLISIQETREELKFKDDQLKKVISSNDFMAENQEEIKRLEMKIKEMSILNNSYISEIEILKTQLLMKDQLLDVELTKNNSLVNELSSLQNEVVEVKSLPYAIKVIADEGYFTLKKIEIEELHRLFVSIQNTVEQLQQGNLDIKDENNNLKLIIDDYTHQMNNIKDENNNLKLVIDDYTHQMNNTKEENNNLKLVIDDFTHQMNNTEKENNELKSQLNLIEINIKSIIKEFSACNEIDVDNSGISSLLNFAAKHFEQNTDQNEKLSNENLILKEKLSFSNNHLCQIKSFVFDNLDNILTIISTMEVKSKAEIEKLKKDLTDSLKENIFLKSCIQMFNELTFECVEIIEQVKTNQSSMTYLQEELTVCNAIKNEFQVQCEQLNKLNVDLKLSIENQKTVEKKLYLKSTEIIDGLAKLDEVNLMVKTNSSNDISNPVDIEEKSNLLIELENTKMEWLSRYKELENRYQSDIENIKQKIEIEKQSEVELVTNNLQNSLDKLKEMKMKVQLNLSEIDELNTLLHSKNSELDKNSKLIIDLESDKLELNKKLEELAVSENKTQEELMTVNKELYDIQIKNNSNFTIIENLKDELDTIKFELEEKSNIVNRSEVTMCNYLKEINILNNNNIKLQMELEEKSKNESELKYELHIVTNEIEDAIVKTNEVKAVYNILNNKCESKMLIVEQLNNKLQCINSTLNEKNSLIVELENTNLELLTKCENLDVIDQLNKTIVELQMKLENKIQIENEMHNELRAKIIQLENESVKEIELQDLVESMKNELECINSTLNEKNSLIAELENTNLELLTKCENLDVIDQLNKTIVELQMKLEDKIQIENEMHNELRAKIIQLENASVKEIELQDLVESMKNELECINSTLNEKNSLIVELENTNLELLTKCENLDVIDQLNKTIIELQLKLENKIQIENEMHNELQAKIIQLENASVKEIELQALVESMKNEIELNIISVKNFESELATKSNLLTKLEVINSELLLKFNEMNETNLSNMNEHKKIQDQLQTVIQEKVLIQTDLNLLSVQLLKKTNHHDKIKKHLEDTLQQQSFNYQKLYKEFINFSSDIEVILNLQIDTESKLRAEILYKSTELDDLQKQLYESNLQQDYEKLEEEYILRTRECDEAFAKIKNLESILLTKEESEKVLKDNFKSKCIALEEYKKNVEFLFMRNDSFQMRVNDFEDNVLVDLNEEFDSMKSELTKKIENEKNLIDEKLKLECNLNELQEKLVSTSKALELSEEQSKELASVIDNFVFELKEANSVKENLESRLNQAEHELLKSGDYTESLEHELYNLQTKLENESVRAKCAEKEFIDLKLKCNDQINKKDLEGLDVRNKIIDSLVDYVHDIKLKLTELNSAMISGNQSEKDLRTKVMSVEDDILPLDETWKVACNPSLESADLRIGLEINNLRKLLEDKINLVKNLQNSKNDMEINISKLQDQLNKQFVENNKLINDMALMENDLKVKTSTVNNLSNELNTIKIQYNELEEHNQATKEQIHFSFDIDTELRNGKKNLVNEINLLEPGKITGVLTHHNLSNLLVTFVNLIMTKEQQIVADLVYNQNKIKQQYEEQIRQFEEDIKKGKEWQEQVESDNEKLSLELENLKLEKHNFPCKEIEIKELTEKLLETENQSFNYLCELQELKTLFNKENEQNYKSLSNEFEIFKISSEQSIQNLKNKLEDLTHKYNESLSMYKDQTNSRSTLEGQIEKLISECTCLKAVIEKKDEDIKNLFEKVQLKTLEYEALIEKNNLLKDEMKEVHGKKIDELQLELNDKIQQIYRTEKLLKEVTKNYNQLIEERSLNLLQTKHQQENDNSDVNVRIAELEHDIETVTAINKTNIESLHSELKVKSTKLEETQLQCSKLIQELELYKLKVIEFEKQIESYQQSLKLKDVQIENYQIKLNLNENDLTKINNITEKLRELLKCTGTLPIIYDNISLLMVKCGHLEDEIKDLKHINVNLDNECEAMLIEIKNKDNKIIELITSEDEIRQTIELLTEEKEVLKNKCEQLKNVNGNIKKLNDEIGGYEQNIYQLRKEKGQLIVQHDKEINQLKTELKQAQSENQEILIEYNKLSETAKNLEKSLKEDIQQLNRCIVDKNAKISTLELFSKTNADELKKKNRELEYVYKRARDENHMLRKELRHIKEITHVTKVDQYTQTVEEEQSMVGSAMLAGHKSMTEKITKLENDNYLMKKMLHHRKTKIEDLQKQLAERHN